MTVHVDVSLEVEFCCETFSTTVAIVDSLVGGLKGQSSGSWDAEF